MTTTNSALPDYERDLTHKDPLRNQENQPLQQAINEGLNSGKPKPFDAKAFKDKMVKRFNND